MCGLVLAVAIVSMSSKGPRSTGLAMMGDIATINDIHSAYIHGSVPTAIGESNDIMNLNFPDEVGAVQCCRRVVYGCCWVLVCVRVCWLVLKPPFAPS